MTARAETVTILFTDLVGSTELLQRAGDEQAQRIFKAHHRLLREAVEAHGGHEVKWLGDGLMVAFPSALQAMHCAVAMQQASRRPAAGERLEIRAGLHVGEAIHDESDYFGTSVVVSRRLCDRAGSGQIFASDIVVRLLDGRQEFVFQKLGELRLKGITDPIPAVEVLYEHDPLALVRRTPFAGRRQELAAMDKALASAKGGQGSIVLLAGEPGIGKTRLAEEFSAHADASGAVATRGGCYEGDVSSPYRPWVEALRAYATACPDDDLREHMGAGAPEVITLMPELRQRYPDIDPAPKLEAEAERLRLFDSVSDFIRRAARSRPLVVFLDDLHWADKPSLLLLQHVARNATQDPLLLLGSYHDADVDRAHPLAEALATLRRLERYQRVVLHGLPREEVDELLASIEPSEESRPVRRVLGAVLFRETEGNPLFIRELIAHLIEAGKIVHEGGRWTSHITNIADLGIPEGVREVIGRRLSRLGEECNRMLRRASAMSGGFTWDELKPVCAGEFGEAELLDLLDEALGAQVVKENAAAPGTYDFTHALIREVLYDELSTPRRMRLHRQIAGALEELYASNVEPHLSKLAHHFFLAASAGEYEKALGYTIRAAERATTLLAYEETASHYERAIELLDLLGSPAKERRCELLLALGHAQRISGEPEKAMASFETAAAAARQDGSAALLARAGLGFEEAAYDVVGDASLRPKAAELLDEALASLDTTDSALRALALSRRTRLMRPNIRESVPGMLSTGAATSHLGPRFAEAIDGARQAVAMARRLGDPALTARVLTDLCSRIWSPAFTDERLRLSAEAIECEAQARDPSLEFDARNQRSMALLEAGDIAELDVQIERTSQIAGAARQPFLAFWDMTNHAMRALFDGRLEEADRLTSQALSLGQRANYALTLLNFATQLYFIRRDQGRLGEVESITTTFMEQNQDVPAIAAAMANLLVETGRLEEARTLLERLATDNVSLFPDDFLRLLGVALLADVAVELDDGRYAPALYEHLLPFEARNLSAGVAVALGAVSRSLGRLAGLLERWDDAERHFEHAVAMNERMGARPYLARTRMNYAAMLLRRGSTADRGRAVTLLDQTFAAAREMGMAKVVADCERLRASAG